MRPSRGVCVPSPAMGLSGWPRRAPEVGARPCSLALELELHVVFGREAHARAEGVLEHGALLGQGVHDGLALGHQGRLGQVRQEDGDGVEVVEGRVAVLLDLQKRPCEGRVGDKDRLDRVGGASLSTKRCLLRHQRAPSDRRCGPGMRASLAPHLDAGDELGEDDEVEDDGRGKERVLARVVDGERVAAAHEDLRRVLVHRTLRVAHVRHVLDHHQVVGVLAGLVQDLRDARWAGAR